jgi:hypothetical protein
MEVADFSKTRLKDVLPELKKLTLQERVDLGSIQNLLASAGIKLVYVPGFPNCPVFGVTRKI